MEKLLASFPRDRFIEPKQPQKRGGALITKIDLAPSEVFELLEKIYGPYKDHSSGFVFVDDKTTWERTLETKNGILRVYDFKGSMSIGNGSELTNALKDDAEELKVLFEEMWPHYLMEKKQELKKQVEKDPLPNFMRTFIATHDLLKRSKHVGSLMEGLVLLATLTDAQLRYGILLSRQLKESTEKYDPDLIYQRSSTYLSERKIQKMAFDEGLISVDEYEEISDLYSLRNRAVHRYFISDFEYAELPSILDRYEKLMSAFDQKILELENLQVENNIGIVKKDHLEVDVGRIITEGKLKIDSSRPTAILPKRRYMFPREFGPPCDSVELP